MIRMNCTALFEFSGGRFLLAVHSIAFSHLVHKHPLEVNNKNEGETQYQSEIRKFKKQKSDAEMLY